MDVIVADIVGLTTAQLKPYLLGALLVGPIVAGLVVYGALGGFDGDGPPDGGSSDEGPTDDGLPDDDPVHEEADE
jgi:cytochrome b-561